MSVAFVLDCSVALAWLFRNEATPETAKILRRIDTEASLVPASGLANGLGSDPLAPGLRREVQRTAGRRTHDALSLPFWQSRRAASVADVESAVLAASGSTGGAAIAELDAKVLGTLLAAGGAGVFVAGGLLLPVVGELEPAVAPWGCVRLAASCALLMESDTLLLVPETLRK